jgi:acyl-CoA synthetase (NDP forming)
MTVPARQWGAKRDEVQGIKCYPSLEAVPGPIDLAVLAMPAAAMGSLAGATGMTTA